MIYTEEKIYTEYEGIPVTREISGGETKSVEESEYEGLTKVDEVLGKFIRWRQSYNIYFQLGVSISYEGMK